MALRALLCALVAVPASAQLLGGLRTWAEEESNETHYWDDVRRMLLPRGRMECAVGWGQENEDNIRLYIKKEWTRVCYYCMYLETSSSSDMELLVAGSTWDEQQFYRVFHVNACGGMFGTPKYMENNNGCGKGTIELTKNNEGDETAGRRPGRGPPAWCRCFSLGSRRHRRRGVSAGTDAAGWRRPPTTRSATECAARS